MGQPQEGETLTPAVQVGLTLLSCRVYTPAKLANSMVRALGGTQHLHWLEPGFGRGAFLREIAALGSHKEHVVGIDLDRRPSSVDSLGTVLRGQDFFSWQAEGRRFDRIVGNPPYIAIEKLREPLRATAAEATFGSIGKQGAGGNLWASFLIRCLSLLKTGGHLSFVLPAAWSYADYASGLRKKLPTYFREFVVHRSKETLFSDVQDGCIVLQCFGFGEPNRISSKHLYDSAADLIRGLRPPVRQAVPSIQIRARNPAKHEAPAASLLRVRLGAVTGDAKYFLLGETRRKELRLPLSSVVPVLTKAKHIRDAVFDRYAWAKLRDADDRTYLFRPTIDCLKNPNVDAYLRLSTKDGGCNRNAGWVAKRDPWHRVALPADAHAFMSGVSSLGPFLTLNKMEGLTATNTLYIISFFPSYRALEARAAIGLAFISGFVRSQVDERTRTYAGGMKKLEPSDLSSLILPIKSNSVGAIETLVQATQMLTSGSSSQAAELADDWFASV